MMFRPNLTRKPGVFQPVTGQAVVVVTTAVDQGHIASLKGRQSEMESHTKKHGATHYKMKDDVVGRVESHLVALKKKNNKQRYFKGTGADLKIFTAINGLSSKALLEEYEHVGVVQTPINPVSFARFFYRGTPFVILTIISTER